MAALEKRQSDDGNGGVDDEEDYADEEEDCTDKEEEGNDDGEERDDNNEEGINDVDKEEGKLLERHSNKSKSSNE